MTSPSPLKLQFEYWVLFSIFSVVWNRGVNKLSEAEYSPQFREPLLCLLRSCYPSYARHAQPSGYPTPLEFDSLIIWAQFLWETASLSSQNPAGLLLTRVFPQATYLPCRPHCLKDFVDLPSLLDTSGDWVKVRRHTTLSVVQNLMCVCVCITLKLIA